MPSSVVGAVAGALALAAPLAGAYAQNAVSGSASSAAAVAVASGSSTTFNQSSTVNYPHQPPAQALGSFGQGANPCAEGAGFNLGTGYVGLGFNQATSNTQCNDRLTAAALLEVGRQFGDERARAAGILTLCGSDPRILEKCQWAGLWVRPAVAAPPAYSQGSYYYGTSAYGGASAGGAYARPAPAAYARPAPALERVYVPAYVPAGSVRPAWCEGIVPGERVRFARDCGY